VNDTNEIPHPLRLALGSHQRGSGRGCAMNMISYENGDSTISDMPSCTDRVLARIVQRVNDTYCRHTVDGMLCPACSIVVLDLAHRTVGTGGMVLAPDARRRVWVAIAADQARQVLHLARDQAKAERYIVIAEKYATTGEKPAAYAASDASDASATHAAYDASDASRLQLAHRAIDLFQQLTGHNATNIPPAAVHAAYTQMVTVA
jgi:hypothetical protein